MRHGALALLLVFPTTAGTSWAQVGHQPGMLDPNLATEQDLAGLPSITPAIARAIIGGRPFLDMKAVNRVLTTWLSPGQRTEVYRQLFLHVDLNTATREELELIPGVGTGVLGEVLEHRPYRDLTGFRRAIGRAVGDAELARLEGYVFVPIDLNSASDEDLLTIPGLGRRMLHELTEHRPYRTIEQFRHEAGRYVDGREVARIERYITIR